MASIRKRKSARTGAVTFQVQWRDGGKQRTFSLADEPSAHRFVSTLLTRGERAAILESVAGPVSSTAPGLVDWIDKHITDLTGVTPGTKAKYRRIAATTYGAELGNIPLDMLTRADVARAMNALSIGPRKWTDPRTGRPAAPLAPKSVRNAHGLLVAALDYARVEKVIEANPAQKIRLPKVLPPQIRVLTDDEVDALLEAIPEHYRPLIALIACTGLRWGEATALTVGDVNLTSRMLRVHSAWKMGEGSRREIGTPKTTKSHRTVGFRSELLPAIEPLVRGRAKSDYLFTTTRGTVITHGHFHARVWQPACERAGLEPAPTIHGLRHYHASFLVSQGVPLPVVQLRLGHEDISTTIGTYSHLMPATVQAAVDAAELSRPALGR